jgi:hypothetical protein
MRYFGPFAQDRRINAPTKEKNKIVAYMPSEIGETGGTLCVH